MKIAAVIALCLFGVALIVLAVGFGQVFMAYALLIIIGFPVFVIARLNQKKVQ